MPDDLEVKYTQIDLNQKYWVGFKDGAMAVLTYHKQHPELSLDDLADLAAKGAAFAYGWGG